VDDECSERLIKICFGKRRQFCADRDKNMNFADNDTISNLVTGDYSVEGFLLCERYKIIRKIGEGGMGAVFLAEDIRLNNRQVALKSLPLIVAGNRRALQQLKTEALVAIRLSHPNIVTLRSFEESAAGPFLVMDYISGKTLEDIVTDRNTLPEDDVLKLFKPIAEALDYAHSQGIVHRDIKPSNILIRDDGVPFIMDFGIAREMKESMTRLTGKDTSGTLPYMSPEQVRGAVPAPAQDVYSLAVAMYECLTGKPPFCRGDIHYQIINEPVDGSNLPDGLRENVIKGLDKNPGNRPGTCADLVGSASKGKIQRRRTGKNLRNTCTKENAKVDDIRSKAVQLADQGRFDEALDMLRKLRDLYPSRTDISDAMLTIMEQKVERTLSTPVQTFPSISMPEPVAPSPSHKQTKVLDLGKGVKLEMIYLQGGSFLMGSPSDEKDRDSDEGPVHTVELDGFWIGKYTVTQLQYQSIIDKAPFYFQSEIIHEKGFLGIGRKTERRINPHYPAETVSWNDAMEFCRKLSQRTGKTFTLPTEAQWEYACRAGTTTRYYFGDNDRYLKEYGWFNKNSNKQTHPIGQKKPNVWGLYDMHGNVWEWCLDWYGENYYSQSPRRNPAGPGSGSYRVRRGGSWSYNAGLCRSAYRSWSTPSDTLHNLGFRLVIAELS
jgi:eukaryotic-like serine/threonine-protein kinase